MIQKKCHLITTFFTEHFDFDKNSLKILIFENDNQDLPDKSLFSKKVNEKIIYNILEEKLFNYKNKIKKESKNEIISNFFSKFLEENQNILPSYFKNTVDDINQPNYEDFLFSINNKIDKIFFNFIEPYLSLNYKISIILNLKNNTTNISKNNNNSLVIYNSFRKRINIRKIYYMYNYNNYININEIISSIMSTKFHSIDKLNSLFQIKAINYIINSDSYFLFFISELYKSIYKKVTKRNNNNKFTDYPKFTIKIEEGKRYTKEDFLILQKSFEKKEEQKENKNKSNKKNLNDNEKIQYKLCKYDTDFEYDNNYFPFKSVYYLNGKEYKPQEIFKDYLVESKAWGFGKYVYKVPSKNLTLKGYKLKNLKISEVDNFINIYDFIFTIKNIDENNTIIIEKNDISELLKPYSKEEIFNSLLNKNFHYKCDEEEQDKIDDIIKGYLKIKFN